MEAYSLLALKLLMGILGLVLQINLLGKGNLAPPPPWIKCKTMFSAASSAA